MSSLREEWRGVLRGFGADGGKTPASILQCRYLSLSTNLVRVCLQQGVDVISVNVTVRGKQQGILCVCVWIAGLTSSVVGGRLQDAGNVCWSGR